MCLASLPNSKMGNLPRAGLSMKFTRRVSLAKQPKRRRARCQHFARVSKIALHSFGFVRWVGIDGLVQDWQYSQLDESRFSPIALGSRGVGKMDEGVS
jgi:hypothetical protein